MRVSRPEKTLADRSLTEGRLNDDCAVLVEGPLPRNHISCLALKIAARALEDAVSKRFLELRVSPEVQ